MSVESVKYKNQQLAIIIYDSFKQSGVHFFTSGEVSQQLAYMNHPKGKRIDPHVHNPVRREVMFTQEVLFIKSGKLRVDFYTDNKEYIKSRVLKKGDVILLMTGGHGFEVLEEIEMIEVKQGPYAGENDKTKF
jgi:mannose-6-phosphate isomerase-like protein (cupin superfamily)